MNQKLTPRQLAEATGVSESSIKRWCDAGTIATVRTAGGHRRIPLSGAIQFLRENDHPLLHPEILGLTGTGTRSTRWEEAPEKLRLALEAGQEEACRQILFDLYLSRRRISEIGDQVIAPAFGAIGHRWEQGEVAVFQERRAYEIMRNLLHELRLAQAPLDKRAPIALGGTPAGDNYALASALVELVLREVGWRACLLGTNLPLDTLRAALQRERPRLFWLSVSHLEHEADFLRDFAALQQVAGERTAITVGGRALHEHLRRQMTYASFCETLQHLETFGATLLAAGKE